MGWFHWQCEESAWPRELPDFRRLESAGLPSQNCNQVNRHGSPNLNAQLEIARGRGVERIICSALDGDASLRLNAAVANSRAEEVVAGVVKLAKISRAAHVWIVAEADAPPAWDRPLRSAAKSANVHLVELENHYPQADPTLLLHVLCGKRLMPGKLPAECGVLLVDAPGAMSFAAETVAYLPVGILDHQSGRSFYFDVPPGTEWNAALNAAGISAGGAIIRAGDWPRDLRIESTASIGAGELTIHVFPQTLPQNPQACIRCGWCVQVCPTHAHPALLLEAAQLGDARRARRGGLSSCIECGVCDQICPAHLPLLAAIRKIK